MTVLNSSPYFYLQTVAALGLLPHHVQHAVHQLGALGVVPLGPVVAGPGLPEHKVVRAKDTAVGAGPDDNLLITRKEMFGDIDSIFLVCKDLR